MTSNTEIISMKSDATFHPAPIHKFPTEILTHIFSFVIHDPRSRVKPFLLTSICKRWADIATNTPSLWTRIRVFAIRIGESLEDRLVMALLGIEDEEEFEDLDSTKYDFDAMVKQFTADVIAKWVSRTRNLPLDICIDIFENGLDEDSTLDDEYGPGEWGSEGSTRGALSDLLEMFLPYSERWRSLRLPLHNEVIKPLQGLLNSNDRLPILKSLEFLQISRKARWLDLRNVNALRSLTISNPRITHPLRNLPLRWENLTRFVCNTLIQIDGVLAILAKCSSAIDLAFDRVAVRAIDDDDFDSMKYVPFKHAKPRTLEVPQLQHLVICMHDKYDYDFEANNVLRPVFKNLTAPSLQTLVIEEQFVRVISFKDLEAFIKRSNCKIRKLVLNGIREDSSGYNETLGHSVKDLVSLLTSLTSVEELTMHLSPCSEGHDLWTALHNSWGILPAMKEFNYTGPLHFTASNLSEILKNRRHASNSGTARLERAIVKVNYVKDSEPIEWPGIDGDAAEIIAGIRQLINDGMLISIAGLWEERDVFGFREKYEFDVYPDDPFDFWHKYLQGYVARHADPYWED